MKHLFLTTLILTLLTGCGVEWFPETTITVTPLSVTTTTLPNGTVGTAYSQTLSATGGSAPYTWSVSSGTLPAGLTLNTAGLISGNPTTTGTSPFTVLATDSANPATTATQSLSITVN